jgi:hypothetical protein
LKPTSGKKWCVACLKALTGSGFSLVGHR